VATRSLGRVTKVLQQRFPDGCCASSPRGSKRTATEPNLTAVLAEPRRGQSGSAPASPPQAQHVEDRLR
jgi:hypothetical protein